MLLQSIYHSYLSDWSGFLASKLFLFLFSLLWLILFIHSFIYTEKVYKSANVPGTVPYAKNTDMTKIVKSPSLPSPHGVCIVLEEDRQ